MTKKTFLPLLLILTLLLCGCTFSQTPDDPAVSDVTAEPEAPAYPALAPVSDSRKEALQLAEADSALCTFSYPGEDWEFSVSDDLPTLIHYKNGIADGMRINLSLNGSRKMLQKGVIDQTVADGLLAGYAAYVPGVVFKNEQLYTFMEETVFRFDATLPFDDAYIDLMLEKGALTEDSLALAGGREALLALPAVQQCVLCAVVGEDVVSITGAYADTSQKVDLSEAMRILLETLKIK